MRIKTDQSHLFRKGEAGKVGKCMWGLPALPGDKIHSGFQSLDALGNRQDNYEGTEFLTERKFVPAGFTAQLVRQGCSSEAAEWELTKDA